MNTARAENKPLPDEVKTLSDRLPENSYKTPLLTTFILWREGYNMREILPRPTYFRHRSQLKTYGYDISKGAA